MNQEGLATPSAPRVRGGFFKDTRLLNRVLGAVLCALLLLNFVQLLNYDRVGEYSLFRQYTRSHRTYGTWLNSQPGWRAVIYTGTIIREMDYTIVFFDILGQDATPIRELQDLLREFATEGEAALRAGEEIDQEKLARIEGIMAKLKTELDPQNPAFQWSDINEISILRFHLGFPRSLAEHYQLDIVRIIYQSVLQGGGN